MITVTSSDVLSFTAPTAPTHCQSSLKLEETPLTPTDSITYKSPSLDYEISPQNVKTANRLELTLLGALSHIPPLIESTNSQSSTIYSPPPCSSYYGGIQILEFDFQYSPRHGKRYPTCTTTDAYSIVSGSQIIFARKSWNFPGRFYVAERCLKIERGTAHVEIVTYRLANPQDDSESYPRDPDAPPYVALFPEECVHMPCFDRKEEELDSARIMFCLPRLLSLRTFFTSLGQYFYT